MLKRASFLWFGFILLATSLQGADQPLGIPFGGHRVHPTRILARYKDAQGPATLQSADKLSSLGLAVRREHRGVQGLVAIDTARAGLARQASIPADPAAQAEALSARIGELRRSGLFDYVEPDYVVYADIDPTDSRYVDGTLWGLRNDGGQGGVVGADISARDAWDITRGSTNVIVAVVDTGIRYTHNELRRQVWVNSREIPGNGADDDNNGIIDDVHGVNALDPDDVTGDPMDLDEHGTHVSGTIGAAANDGNPHVGVAWDVRLMGCKFLGASGGYTEGAIICLEYALANGARVLNNSWGGGAFSTALRDVIQAAQDQGVLFVAAAGNTAGNDNDLYPHYPSSYELDGIIAVAALTRADQLASFSCFGAKSVDVGAPGQEIYSSVSASDDAYASFDGTSMASPHVAGVAALICARYPSISLYELKDRIIRTVVPVDALAGITSTGGRVNAYKALSAEGDGFLELTIQPPSESVLLPNTTQSVFAVVTDTFGVTNALVSGRFTQGLSNILNFANSGTAPDAHAGDFIYSAAFTVPTNVQELTLEVVATAPGKQAATNIVHWWVAAPPLNDYFVNAPAFKIPGEGGVVFSNNKFATFESPEEPFHAGDTLVDGTLWWTWSPAFDNRVLIDTAGTEFDCVLAVYTNKTLATLREVASADNVGSKKQPYVQFDAKLGTTYYIVAGGAKPSERGSLRIRVAPNALPDTVPPVVAFSSPLHGTTLATNKVNLVGLADDSNGGSGVLQVLVRLSTDPVPRIATGTTNWTAPFLLKRGENVIYAWAADQARNVSDPISIVVNYLPPTVDNDHFANAYKLEPPSGGRVGADNRNATKEYQEPLHANNDGGHSVWYRWTAPDDGVLTLATTNVTYDTMLGLYTGSAVGNLTTIAYNDDAVAGNRLSRLTSGVRKGVVYSIALDGYAASTGTNVLTYEFTGSAVRQLTVTSSAGGRVKPGTGTYALGASVTLTATADPGYAFTGWTGDTGGGANATANPLQLTMDQDRAVRAGFASVGVTEGFESGTFGTNLTFTTGGGGRWTVKSGTASEGNYAVRSAAISANGVSSMVVSNEMVAGIASFYYQVSSEPIWDSLQFYMNGELKGEWSGDTGWQIFQFAVPSGVNVLEWRYQKDSSWTQGLDAAFVDNVNIPLAPKSTGTAARLQVQATAAGSVTLRLRGESGTSYSIQVSGDLQHWTPVGSQTASEGWVDVNVTPSASGARFYRAVSQ